ncbi:preprotein translocase subunit SecA [Arthrobacter sp. V4I6]|nr:preprotein translocase subunit SecA [Arthrobacter sp. V4I6]
MASLIEKLLRTGDKKTLRQLRNYADSINALESSFKTFTDAELREETDRLRARHLDGETLEDLLPEAFAAVREASSPNPRHAPLRCPADGRRRPPPGQHR